MSIEPKHDDSAEFKRWYEIGMQAVQAESWLYALECLTKAVAANGDDREARKQKHRASRRVYKQNGGQGKAKGFKLTAVKSRLMTAEASGDWAAVDLLAEEVLARNPWDACMFAAVARAAEKRKALDIAEYAWVCAVKIDATQVNWFRALGDLLHRAGRYGEAKGCYSRIQQIAPGSRGGEELMQAVDVATLLRDGGVHLRRVSQEQEFEESSAERSDALDERTADLPAAEDAIQQAEEFVRNEQFGQALELYRNVTKQLPENQSIQDRSEEIHLALLRKRASSAAAAAARNPLDERLAELARHHADNCHQHEFAVLQGRVQRDDDDLLQTFRLADLCRRTGRIDEAFSLFERCSSNEDLHAESLIGMGECCLKSSRAAVGRRHLETALTKISAESRPNSVKLAHYWLGRYFEAAHAKPQAIWHYQRVMALDGQFRDVPNRLTALQAPSSTAAVDAG